MIQALPVTTSFAELFGVKENWDTPHFRWHDHYPPGAPPGCIYPRMRIEQFLIRVAEKFGDRTALHFYSTNWSYKSLLERVRKVAAEFHAMGIGPGDRALLVLPNCPEFIVSWFALHFLGAEVIHGSPLYPGAEIASLIRRTRPKVVIGLDVRLEPCTDALKEVSVPYLVVTSLSCHLPVSLSAIYTIKTWLNGSIRVPRETKVIKFSSLYSGAAKPLSAPLLEDDDRVAVLQPTGGTTGTPKLAMCTHRNLVAQVCQSHAMTRRAMASDVAVAVLPFFHVYGSTLILLGCVSGAATMVLFPRFDAKQIADALERYQPTALPLVPFMFEALARELERRPRTLNRLELVTSGASPLDPVVRNHFAAQTNITITEGYGLSEASPVLTANFGSTNRTGSVGVPLPDTEVRIVDAFEGKRPLGPGEVGELVARGPQIMKGYLDNPEETERTVRDGWLFTGDLAIMDQDGYFQIVDRKKDMIISGGLNVFPSEVETKILALEGVAQCAVVGERDIRWGEKVIAYVVLKPGASFDEKAMKEKCRVAMAQYKIPREFRVVEKLPTNFLGKIRRAELRGSQITAADSPRAAAS